jgi:hypothetical protein
VTADQARGTMLQNRIPISPSPVPSNGFPVVSHPPTLPEHLAQSRVMISSLPSISTNVDGITKQFYGGANVPTRRLILPG